ncbi:hypothetical protein [Micromonospora sp. NPDC005806]|uniref:hypothetical protein n=1 Tax=Micromonospora sp. NPDC005806 TaxID=3364234 RepID=UPI00368692E9
MPYLSRHVPSVSARPSVSVWLAEQVGEDKVVEMAQRLLPGGDRPAIGREEHRGAVPDASVPARPGAAAVVVPGEGRPGAEHHRAGDHEVLRGRSVRRGGGVRSPGSQEGRDGEPEPGGAARPHPDVVPSGRDRV